jgi:hypothetical protein
MNRRNEPDGVGDRLGARRLAAQTRIAAVDIDIGPFHPAGTQGGGSIGRQALLQQGRAEKGRPEKRQDQRNQSPQPLARPTCHLAPRSLQTPKPRKSGTQDPVARRRFPTLRPAFFRSRGGSMVC